MEHEYTQPNEVLASSSSSLPLGSISDILNRMFKPGDRLQLYAGAEPYKETGSFLATTDDVLIWVDEKNHVSFQYIGGNLGIRKIGSSTSTSESKKEFSSEKKNTNQTAKQAKKKEDETSAEEIIPPLAQVGDSSIEASSTENITPLLSEPKEAKYKEEGISPLFEVEPTEESVESSSVAYFTLESSEESSEDLIEEVKKKLAEVEKTLSKEKK